MDKMLEAFQNHLKPGYSYTYKEIIDRMEAFIAGWNACKALYQIGKPGRKKKG